MHLLYTLMTTCAEELQPHYASIITLCSQTLANQANSSIANYTVLYVRLQKHFYPLYRLPTLISTGQVSLSCRALTEMVPWLGSDHLKSFQALVPHILAVIRQLVQVDEVRV